MDDLPASSVVGETLDAVRANPRPVLAIGVTGHRAARLDTAALPALTATIDATLAQIEQIARAQAGTAELRAVTALADGADSLVSAAALARGWPLFSVLPFARAIYAADFTTGHTRAVFDRLLAASARVFELADDGRGDTAPAAYERAGRIVLAQCDMLIAVWDGQPALGRGGTGDIVAEAIASGIPVIRIDPSGQTEPLMLAPGQATTLSTGLPDLIRAVLRAPTGHGSAGLAVGLDCLAIAARIGLGVVRDEGDQSRLRQAARRIALPAAVVDRAYLTDVYAALLRLIDARIARQPDLRGPLTALRQVTACDDPAFDTLQSRIAELAKLLMP